MVRIIAFDKAIDRTAFCSGSEPLDRYIHEQVSSEIRRNVAKCFLAVDEDDQLVGYYTLSASIVHLAELPEELARKLPRYVNVPVALMGRLAIGETAQGRGLGPALLADAFQRVATSDVAAFAVTVDAKDENALGFYLHHGFIEVRPRFCLHTLTALR